MIFSYNWLKDYIKGKVPSPSEIAKIFTKYSFEVESLKKRADDWIFDIDILPNRASDCLSYIGVAREAVAVLKFEKGAKNSLALPKNKLRENKKIRTKDVLEVKVENSGDCQRYMAMVVFGVKVGKSPKAIQKKLKSCGLEPINNIVDITNYVMLETGQPLHAFDFDKIETAEKGFEKESRKKIKKIFVRRARKGEKVKALDQKTYQLDDGILVIADAKKPLCLAGIKGGENSGIDEKTKNIVIEAANFNPGLIRRASKKLKLKTDASWRFENGIDPNLIDFAQKRVLSLIQKEAKGDILSGPVDFYPKKRKPKKIMLDLGYLNSLLGVKVSKQTAVKALRVLDFMVSFPKNKKENKLLVTPPTRRLDISIEEDLIEEVARLIGYQNIPSVIPKETLLCPSPNDELFWQRFSLDVLKEMGFSQAYNYSFIGEKDKEIFCKNSREIVEVQNPISSFNKYLRPNLIINLLKNVKENFKYFDQVKLFEIGKIFKKEKGKFFEAKALSGIFSSRKIDEKGFYLLKGFVDSLLEKMGISDVWYDDWQPSPEQSSSYLWQAGESAEIKSGDEEIGYLGAINWKILKEMGIGENVFAFDFDFAKLVKLSSEENEYRPISNYPAAIRDLAVLVPRGEKVVNLLNIINRVGGKLVRDVDLFDIYVGENIPYGRKNFAFHIIYQASDHTLSSKEVDSLHNKIIKAIEKNPEYEVRKQ